MTTKGLIALGIIAAVAAWAVWRRKPSDKGSESPPRVDHGDPTGRGNVGMWSGGDGGIGGGGEG